MTLTTRCRYAVRIMIRMAIINEGGHLAQKEVVARAESISSDYVEQLLITLKSAGLVKSVRGVKGGFSLAKPASDITASAIVEAMEGSLAMAPCLTEPCERERICATRDLWQAATSALSQVFESKTLAELAQRTTELENAHPITFQI